MKINFSIISLIDSNVLCRLLAELSSLLVKKSIVWQLIAWSFLSITSVQAKAEGIYAYVDALAYTDFLSIDLHDEYASGEYFFSDATAGVGYQFTIDKNTFGVGAFSRFLMASEFSEDASEVFNAAINERNLDYGRTYNVDFDFSAFIAEGVEVFFERRATERFIYSARLQAFSSDLFLDGSGNGFIFFDGDITSVAQYDLFYHSDPILEREVTSPSGRGFSLDLAINYVWSDKLSFGLALNDAAGKIKWSNAPITLANINAQSTTLVTKRKLIEKSSISGREFYKDFEKKLPATYRLQVLYGGSSRLWYASAYKNNSFYDMHLGFINEGATFNYFFGVSPLRGNVELGLKKNKWRLSIAFENINLPRSQYFRLNLSRDFDWGLTRINE